ncbi:unnamed protein product [Prorocentrum cordatum]|uniref:Protein kinase domain-containing protein n=1 Tax=Prorocentrum cordatum TaxID=2364126 RepID=A0ABN9SGG1_9DINO|nr:unnamed protein product [Polarella glacialis]
MALLLAFELLFTPTTSSSSSSSSSCLSSSSFRSQLWIPRALTGWPPRVKQVGKRLLEAYDVGDVLGEGAFGVVYAAVHKETGTEVAIKMVDKVETPISQIRREMEILMAAQHEGTVKFHGVVFETCFVCFVMDKYSGGNLMTGLRSRLEQKGKIGCLSLVHICAQMTSSVCYIHGLSIVHRDIKSDNYLKDRADICDPQCRIALTDFGSSSHVNPGTRLSAQVGTRRYWAPEIFRKSYGPKVDVWAMGVTMYSLLDGFFPFRNDAEILWPIRELRFPEMDAACKSYLEIMLTREESARASAEGILAHRWIADRAGGVADGVADAPEASPHPPCVDGRKGSPTSGAPHQRPGGTRTRRARALERLAVEVQSGAARLVLEVADYLRLVGAAGAAPPRPCACGGGEAEAAPRRSWWRRGGRAQAARRGDRALRPGRR